MDSKQPIKINENSFNAKRKSLIDPRLTKHPWTGKEVCGSWRYRKKQQFLVAELTIENLLADRALYEDYICCSSPSKQGWHNGRCIFHGGKGGAKPTNGKYVKYLPELAHGELMLRDMATLHETLNDELTIITRFISDRLPTAMSQNASEATQRLSHLIDKLEVKFEQMDFEGSREVMKLIKAECANAYSEKEAKRDVTQLIKDYSSVFEVEMKRRSMTGEYVKKTDMINSYRFLIELVKRTCAHDVFVTVREGFIAAIGRGNFISLRPTDIVPLGISGSNDTDEGAEVISADFEDCSDPLLKGQPGFSEV